MASNNSLLRKWAIAAGALGCVSINNNVIFTYVKHLEISSVLIENSVKYISFLFYRTSVYFTFPNLISAPDYLDTTQHVSYIQICY
jgi:hypothetical protein